MNWYSEEDKLLRRYLLDDVTAEERQQVEERLLGEEAKEIGASGSEDLDYVDRLLLCEDELIDDYACEALSPRDSKLFEQHFLSTPEREQKLLSSRAAARYAAEEMTLSQDKRGAKAEWVIEDPQPYHGLSSGYLKTKKPGWWSVLSIHDWRLVAVAVLVIGLGALTWWQWHQRQQGQFNPASVQEALNQAYSQQRPLEARVTGFGHASFIAPAKQLGGTDAAED
ncbi:MAG: hypothetical protein ACRD82_11615, partial [Blastocatellia bacterium]